MGKRSGQGLNPDGAPWELTLLPDEVFYNLGPGRQNSHFLCLWLGRGVILGVQAAHLMFSRVHFLPCGRVVCM